MAGNQEAFQRAIKQGHSAAWDRDWNHAVDFYRQALDEFPDDPKALSSLGLALFELGELKEALVVYRRVSVITPADPLPKDKEALICERLGLIKDATGAALQAADLYMQNRDIDKAIETWQRVIGFNPSNVTAHSRMATLFERMGRKSDAISEYLAIAALLQHSGDISKATQVVNYALAISPESNPARQALTQLKSNQALPKPSRSRNGSSAPVAPQTPQLDAPKSDGSMDPVAEARQQALTTLASILFDQVDEKPEEQPGRRGLTSISRGVEGPVSEESAHSRMITHLSHAVDAQSQAENELAAKELQQAIDTGLFNSAAFFNQGLLQYNQGDWENALRNLRISVKHNDYLLASRLLMGDCLRKTNHLLEAGIEYLEALKFADSISVPNEQADDIRQLYEPLIDIQSRQTDEKAVNTLCDNVSAQLLRADWRQHLKNARQQLAQPGEAQLLVPLAEVLLNAHSGQVVDMLANVRSLAKIGKTRSAMEEAYYALQFAPIYLPLHIQIAELLLQDGSLAEAIQKFMVVARVYNVRGEVTQAVQLLRRVIQLNSMDLTVRAQLIELLVAQEKTEEGIREYIDLADIYYRQGEFKQARQTFMDALRLAQKLTADHSWSVQILQRMADIDMQRLEWRQAMRVLEQIRTMQPNDEKTRSSLIDLNIRMGQDPAALNELDSFRSYLESNGQQEQAIEFIKNVLNDHPDKIELHKRLADIYRQAKRIPEAIAELDIIGDHLLSTGNRAGAAAVVQAIINLNPPNVTEYQQMLKQIQSQA